MHSLYVKLQHYPGIIVNSVEILQDFFDAKYLVGINHCVIPSITSSLHMGSHQHMPPSAIQGMIGECLPE